MRLKLLIIIALMCSFTAVKGQVDTLRLTEYIDSVRNPELSAQDQMYAYILAVDDVLKQCADYQSYKSVYQFFIYGFSELGINGVVDYMRRLPYLEQVNATNEEQDELIKLAASFERVQIGQKTPDIHAVTIDKRDFDLNSIEDKNIIILFWAESCPHCRDLIHELSEFVGQNDDFTVVTVCVSKNIKKVKRALKKAGMNKYINICDGEGWNSPIIENYAVDMTPSMFLLNKDKIIVAKPFDIDDVINSAAL